MAAGPGSSSVSRPRRATFLLLYMLPSLLLLVIAMWPLIGGSRTLFLRDVTSLHMGVKLFQAEAMRGGSIPMINPYSGGGQPHAGNPNTVALYPDNLLYLLADGHWALNAHFWLHLLLAPITLYWLGRVWGLSREASWVGGMVFGTSGYVLSTLNLYNVVATVAWAPALAAAMLGLAAPARRARWLWATAAVWALLIVSGDPVTAAVALLLGTSAVLARFGLKHRGWFAIAVGIGLGTMLAAPLVLEFLRILSLSFRGHWGYSTGEALVTSWHPIRIVEWFLPLAFGRPDLTFWGRSFHSENLPLFFSLSPGLLAMALALVGHRAGGRAARWAGVIAVLGVLLAMGKYNPLVTLLLKLPGADLFRLPIKFWLLVAVGGSMLAAVGVDKILSSERVDHLRRPLLLLAALLVVGWLVLVLAPGAVESRFAEWMAGGINEDAAGERLRWAGLALLSVLLAGVFLLIQRFVRSRPFVMIALVLVCHLASQLFFLRSLFESDAVEQYRVVSPATEFVPAGARTVHGLALGLEAADRLNVDSEQLPSASLRWLQRSMVRDMYPLSGPPTGRYFEYSLTPEGLDSFLSRAVVHSLEQAGDRDRLRLLAASGVEYLLQEHELDAVLMDEAGVELVGEYRTMGRPRRIYRLVRTTAPAQFVGTLHPSEHLNAAMATILDPGFDVFSEAVLAGRVEPGSGAAGTVTPLRIEPERMIWEVEAGGRGALLVQRAHLPLYRAWVDGEPVPVYVANLSRMAIRVDGGRHLVELRVDRSRFHLGLGLLAVGLLALTVISRSGPLARWLGFRGSVTGDAG